MIAPGKTSANDRTPKNLFKIFKDLCLIISAEVNMKIVQFLDVELSLTTGTYCSPYLKHITALKYVNTKSSHPVSFIKHIPKEFECRITGNSSSKEIFHCKLSYIKGRWERKDIIPTRFKHITRNSDVIWFNPTFNLHLKIKIGRVFFKVLDNHFNEIS